jgi:hypothetical protein
MMYRIDAGLRQNNQDVQVVKQMTRQNDKQKPPAGVTGRGLHHCIGRQPYAAFFIS